MKKIVLSILLTCFSITSWSQCIHLYQCRNCGKNSRGTDSPSSGNYCEGRSNPSLGHSWSDQGMDDPECERILAEQRKKQEAERDKAMAECEKRKVKSYKGGIVTDWHCPSGKPSEVKYSNGIIENFHENGMLEKRVTPQEKNFYVEEFDIYGNLDSKGLKNESGYKVGEWYFTNFKYWKEGYITCSKCIVTYDDQSEFIGIGTKSQIEIQRAFNSCNSRLDYENFRKKYPNSEFDSDALIKISKFKEQEKEIAFVEPMINNWNKLSFSEKSPDFFKEYINKYPNGIKVDAVNKLIKEYNLQKEKINDLKVKLNNCSDAFCIYMLTNTEIADEAKSKLKNYLNQINSSQDGSFSGKLTLSYSLVMEIKEKFGINIFRFMNYEGGWDKSFLFIEEYPILSNKIDSRELIKRNEDWEDRTLSYKTRNGKLSKLTIEWGGNNTLYNCEFFFNKEGKVESYQYRYVYSGTPYEVYKRKLEFDNNGKLIKHDCGDKINMALFQ